MFKTCQEKFNVNLSINSIETIKDTRINKIYADKYSKYVLWNLKNGIEETKRRSITACFLYVKLAVLKG